MSVRSLLAFCLLLLSVACAGKDTNTLKVHQGITQFHARYNDKRFVEIYRSADARLRDSISETDFVSKLTELRKHCGEIHEPRVSAFEEQTWWQRFAPNMKPTRFAGLSSKCSRLAGSGVEHLFVDNGRLQELFLWDVRGEVAQLVKFETDLNAFNKTR